MYIERNGNSEIVHMTDAETAAYDQAEQIVKSRAKKTGVELDEQKLSWSLLGILRERGTSGLLDAANNMTFYQKPTRTRVHGYA